MSWFSGSVVGGLLRLKDRVSSDGRELAREDREWRSAEEQRFQLMGLLAAVVGVAMKEQRSGRDVDEVRAGVIADLSSGFGPEQAAVIADFLVAPGVNKVGGNEVLAKLAEMTGVYNGPQYPADWWPGYDDSPESSPQQFLLEAERNEVLSLAVRVAMEEQRSGREVDEVRAGVVTTLSSAFHPDLAAVIADSLVAPGMSQKDKTEVFAAIGEAVRAATEAARAEIEALEAEDEASTQQRRLEADQRYELMVGLAAVVPATMGKLRLGRDVGEVRAEVVEFLSSAFEPIQAEVIANLLVAPGMSQKDEIEVLRLVLWTTGLWDGGPDLLEGAFEAGILPSDSIDWVPTPQEATATAEAINAHNEVRQAEIEALNAETEYLKAKTEAINAEIEALKAEMDE